MFECLLTFVTNKLESSINEIHLIRYSSNQSYNIIDIGCKVAQSKHENSQNSKQS